MVTRANRPAPRAKQWDLVITRIIDAPRELVFESWTDPKHVKEWWGPQGFTNPVCEVDARPGGVIRIDMRSPDGVVYPMKGVFREVVRPRRLTITGTALEDSEGNPQLETLNTITFDEHNGKTKLTMQARIVKSTPAASKAIEGMAEGWTQSLDRLAEYVLHLRG